MIILSLYLSFSSSLPVFFLGLAGAAALFRQTKKDQVLITFKLCYYVDLGTNCGVAMKAGK